MKLVKKNFNPLAILLVVILTLVCWHKISEQSLMGEGYDYFDEPYSPHLRTLPQGLFTFDAFSRVTFEILPKFFADNVAFYMIWLLVIVTIINILYYLVVLGLTHKKIIALLASIFFVANFTSSYEILAIGFYQWFIQRVFNFIFIFPAFLLLIRFMERKTGRISYLVSIAIWAFSVLGGRFSIYFLPMFAVYPLFYALEKKENRRQILSKVCSSLPYIFVSLVILWLDNYFQRSLIASKSFVEFILNYKEWLTDFFYQIPWLIFPLPILELITEPQVRENMIALSVPVIIFYIVVFLLLLQRQPKLRAVILSTLVFIFGALLLNVFLRATQIYHIYHNGSRYLYVPSMGYSLFWAIILYSFFYRNIIGKLLISGFMIWWIFFNISFIWTNMDERQKDHLASKKILRYVKEKASQYPNDAFVVMPDVIGSHGADFCFKFYGRGTMRFTPVYAEWQEEIGEKFELRRLFFIDYDYQNETVIDRSEEIRNLLKSGKKYERPS